MKETKKIRVKVKKRKLNIKNTLIFLISIILIVNFVYFILNIKIKNIYVINNNIVNDKQIINSAKISDYPSYLLSFKFKIKKNILTNQYIKDVDVIKKNFKTYLYIEEYKPLAIYQNKILLENNTLIENNYNIKGLPIIISDIDTSVFTDNFKKVNSDIILKISQIEYAPYMSDTDRFLLYMNDGNSVYIKLSQIDKLNKYDKIVNKMNGSIGVIELDTDEDNISIKLK